MATGQPFVVPARWNAQQREAAARVANLRDPFIVPDEWTIEQRLAALHRIAWDGKSDPRVRAAARRIRAEADRLAPFVPSRAGHWYARLLALETLRFVHQIPYLPDPPGKDRFAPVWWTLENGGDCDDLAAAYESLGCSNGLRTHTDWVTQPGATLDHVTNMTWIDGSDLWSESSVPGAVLGESPYHAIERQGAWHVMGDTRAPAPDGVGAKAFQWDGWSLYWNGWPVSWFQRHYPYFFHPLRRA